ncbi:hypothetical protein BDZ94DRAFT_1148255, partial [Collybia nuda]
YEKFYYDDGSIILQAENILYKVYRRTLGLKSQFFETMLTLPISTDNVGGLNGTSDATALPLVHTTAEVDALFYFIFNEHDWSTDRPSIASLCSVLKLSTFYLIDSGRDYSIHHLSSHPELQSSLRLHLACRFDIEAWVGIAFRELMSVSILNITNEDRDLIGSEAYHILVVTHAQVDLHRARLAFGPPKAVHANDCVDEPDCSKTWYQAWWG